MLQRLHKSMEKREEGFTLIELLVVMIIIGILAAIAIPIFLNQRNKGYDNAAKSDLRNLAPQQEVFFDDHAAYVIGVSNDEITKALTGWHKSSGVNDVTLANTDATKSWCATAVSKSDTPFYFDSAQGAVKEGKCP